MRSIIAAVTIAMILPGVVRGQPKLKIALAWNADVPKVTDKLTKKQLADWHDRQTQLYVTDLNKSLRFWEFKSNAAAMNQAIATVRFMVKPEGVIAPEIWAYAKVDLGGIIPWTLWKHKLYSGAELIALQNSGENALTQMEDVTARLNTEILDKDLRETFKLLYGHAWIAENKNILVLADGNVALPLLWSDLKNWASSVFKIECKDGGGKKIDRKADGLLIRHLNKFLVVKPQEPLAGLMVRRVYVLEPLELPPSQED